MHKKTIVIALLFILSLNLFGQNPDGKAPVLSKKDVTNFIENFRPISNELDKLDVEYTPGSNMDEALKGLENLEEANKLAVKYGYSSITDFAMKTWAIAACYAVIKLEKEQSPELKNVLQAIDENPNLDAAQKDAAKKQVKDAMQGVQKAMGASTNKADIEVVRPYVDKLGAVLD